MAQDDGTVGKALDVLERVTSARHPLRLTEIMAGAPYPKATLHRLLQTLTRQGMLTHDPASGTYAPGLRIVRMAHAAWARSSLAPLARAHLDALAEATGETVHLAQLDEGQVLYVDKRNAARPVQMFAAAGKVGPAYCTGVGKAMLAFLPDAQLAAALDRQSFHRHTPATMTSAAALRRELADIRATGHALDREEHEEGIICCAAPILSRQGRVLGALSVTSTTARTNLAALAELAPLITRAAGTIAAGAEDWAFPG